MKKEELRIVYMGTPDFAVEPLRCLIENGYNVVGVITMPDKPAGRGYKLQSSPVKKYAQEKGLPLLQPEKLKNETFLEELRQWRADLQIVVAFRMLPEIVWNMPRLGTFNLHASLLPQYRGAAPINRAIMNGEKETGVTTFFLTHEIDTGKIIQQEKISIEENDNAGTIHDKLMHLGSKLVIDTVANLLKGKVVPIAQEDLKTGEALKPAPKLFKDMCRIDWNRPVETAHNHIRGLSPYPAAWSELATPEQVVNIKIFESKKREESHLLKPGTIVTDNKTFLRTAVKNGFIEILSLQVAGKRRMNTEEFLRGFNLQNCSFL